MPYTVGQRITLAIVPRLVAILIRVVGLTLRYEDRVEPGVTPGSQIPGPGVYAFWHRSLLVSAHRFRHLDIAILISRSFDGELIARTVELLGFTAIRGSSTRGGANGLRNIERAYREGHICAVTADGPRGPVFLAKPGTAQLAQLVNANVGTFYVLPLSAWELRSWDRFLIPKPFSRVLITWPKHVPANEVSEATVQAALDRAVAMAVEH
ncbi:MAG: lysophospholipid acyltransferase family protein [Granulicella sp.]